MGSDAPVAMGSAAHAIARFGVPTVPTLLATPGYCKVLFCARCACGREQGACVRAGMSGVDSIHVGMAWSMQELLHANDF